MLLAWTGAASASSLEVRVRTSANVPVEDAAIVLEPASKAPPRRAHATRATHAMIEQLDRDFVPYMTIVQKGTPVDFPNHDPFKHHVYSFSPAKVFEIKLYGGKPVSPIVFDKTGEVVLGCNIHDWMAAHILVVDTPWFAKTRADGTARIDNLPAGSYSLRLWHPRQKTAATKTTVLVGGASRRLELGLEVAPRAVVSKPPPDAASY
jgi:plastocyanin